MTSILHLNDIAVIAAPRDTYPINSPNAMSGVLVMVLYGALAWIVLAMLVYWFGFRACIDAAILSVPFLAGGVISALWMRDGVKGR